MENQNACTPRATRLGGGAGRKRQPERYAEKEKVTLISKSHNALVLSLGDKALREVAKEKTADQVWKKIY